MKYIFLFLLLLFSVRAFSQTYYFSYDSGDDGNPGTIGSPKKTLEEAQDLIDASSDGIILMMADEYFPGSLTVNNKDGTSGDRYIIRTWHKNSADSIARFDGFKELGTFTDEAGNMWSITDTELSSDYRFSAWPPGYMAGVLMRNYLLINGVPYAVSRFPNTGYRVAENWDRSATLAGYVYDNQALDNNYDDAIINFTDEEWALYRAKVDVSGNTINFQYGTNSYDMGSIDDFNKNGDGLKYFLSNHRYFCDENGDHAYDPDANFLSVYWTGNLNSETVKYPVGDYGIQLIDCDYWTLENIGFRGYNRSQVYARGGDYLIVDTCYFHLMPGYSGMSLEYVDNMIIRQNIMTRGISMGIQAWHCDDALYEGNYINDIGMKDQMIADQVDGGPIGIISKEADGTVDIRYNYIDSSGYDGIQTAAFESTVPTSTIVYGNIVTNTGFVLNDGAAIYHWDRQAGGAYTKIIRNNYIDGSYGNPGFSYSTRTWNWGIYLDGGSDNFLIDSNVVMRSNVGVFFNGTDNNEIADNVLYNNATYGGDGWKGAGISWQQYGHYSRTIDCDAHDNIIIMRDLSQEHGLLWWQANDPTLDNQGSLSDYNKFYNPFNESEHVGGTTVWGDPVTNRTRSSMYSALGFENNSTWNNPNWAFDNVSGIYEDEFVWIFYNWSSAPYTFDLGNCTFKQIPSGTNIDTDIEVDPYKFAVLFYVSGSLATVEIPVYPPEYAGGGGQPYPPSGHPGIKIPHLVLKDANNRYILKTLRSMVVGGGSYESEPPPEGENNLLDGLFAYYSFTSDATDDHGTYDGTVNGATHGDPGGGWSGGNCYDFDGSDNINLGDISFTGDSGSISLWCNPDATGYDSRSMMSRWYGYDGLKVLGGNWSAGQDNTWAIDDTDYTTGWHHIAMTYDGVNIRLYVDGVLEQTEAQTGTWSRNGDDWQIGNDGNSTGPWIGYVDEVAISDVVWTATQVETLYNDGTVFTYDNFD